MSKGRLLVVEDDTSSRMALSRIFLSIGYEVLAAKTLMEGMSHLSLSPHGVLLDLKLEESSGVELLRYVRDKGLAVKVAVTTGVSDPDVLKQVEALRPDAVFRKPLQMPELIAWVRETTRDVADGQAARVA